MIALGNFDHYLDVLVHASNSFLTNPVCSGFKFLQYYIKLKQPDLCQDIRLVPMSAQLALNEISQPIV